MRVNSQVVFFRQFFDTCRTQELEMDIFRTMRRIGMINALHEHSALLRYELLLSCCSTRFLFTFSGHPSSLRWGCSEICKKFKLVQSVQEYPKLVHMMLYFWTVQKCLIVLPGLRLMVAGREGQCTMSPCLSTSSTNFFWIHTLSCTPLF